MKDKHTNRSENGRTRKGAGRGFLLLAAMAGIAGLVMFAMKWGGGPPADAGSAPNQSSTNAVSQGESKPFQKLVGRWVRPDGGYILQITAADASGKLDAGYFNPNPIHVARAEASGEGSMIKVLVELRDVNYPGSTYTLGYDSSADQLKGVYFQAVEQQQYEIYFARMK